MGTVPLGIEFLNQLISSWGLSKDPRGLGLRFFSALISLKCIHFCLHRRPQKLDGLYSFVFMFPSESSPGGRVKCGLYRLIGL